MSNRKTKYPMDVMLGAVARVDAGESVHDVADALGVHKSMIYSWKNKITTGKWPRPGEKKPTPSRRTHFMEIPIEKNDNVQDHTNNNETKVAVIVTTTGGLKQVLEGLWK